MSIVVASFCASVVPLAAGGVQNAQQSYIFF